MKKIIIFGILVALPTYAQLKTLEQEVKPTTGFYINLMGMYGLNTANGFNSKFTTGSKKTFNSGSGIGAGFAWLIGKTIGISGSGMFTNRSQGLEDSSGKLVYNAKFVEFYLGLRTQNYLGKSSTQIYVDIGPFYGLKTGTWTADANIAGGSTISGNLTSAVSQNDNIGILTRLGILQMLGENFFLNAFIQVDMGFSKVIKQAVSTESIELATLGMLVGGGIGFKF